MECPGVLLQVDIVDTDRFAAESYVAKSLIRGIRVWARRRTLRREDGNPKRKEEGRKRENGRHSGKRH
jgi:hypothetical protein